MTNLQSWQSVTPLEEFYQLAADAERSLISEEAQGDSGLEPYCLRVVEMARAHPEWRGQFVRAFQNIVTTPAFGAWEIILLCMHILRWPEIELWARRRHAECVTANDWREEPVYRSILDAFQDNWDEDGIYECLKRKEI